MQELKLGRTAVTDAISFLKKHEFIKRVGADKNGYWQILKNEHELN